MSIDNLIADSREITDEEIAAGIAEMDADNRLINLAAEGRIEYSGGAYEATGYYIDIHDLMSAADARRAGDLLARGLLHIGPRLGHLSDRCVIEAIPSGRHFLND